MKKIVSLILLGIILVTALCSCGTHAAATALDEALGSIKSGDFANAAIIEGSAFSDEDDAMLAAMYAKFDYTVGEVAENADGAAVKATITMADVGTVFSNYLTEAMAHSLDENWDADDTRFNEMLTAGDVPLSTFDVTVNMIEKDGKWVVDEENNDELLNAITGGLFSALSGLVE